MRAITIFGTTALTAALFAGIAFSEGNGAHPLIDTQWTLTTLNGSATPEGVTSTLRFGEDAIGGNGGCNTFGGSVAFEGETGLDISQIFSTMMACEPPKQDQEHAFFRALEATTRFTLEDDTLTLLSEDGETLAALKPASD
ncbi:META domain-containing protein [Pelagibacterium halotolerans]|uniref:META domain-containing protein n=1 Tax=Pelagibacterium halotolerans TaxID=531813 RepID=UPI00384BD8AD